jgi:predicted aspartyl protease
MGCLQHLLRLRCLRDGRECRRALLLSTCFVLVGAQSLLAQNASSCSSPDWFVVQQTQREGHELSPLCKGELDAAEDHREAAESELKAVIQGASQSADAFEAHSTLTHFYLRIGRFHDANAQILAMLVTKPTAPDLQNVRSLFALLATYPDLAVVSSHPATVSSHMIDGNVFAPVTVNGSTGAYMLDTGLNLSMMSEAEARELGLVPQSSATSVTDISGLSGPGARVVQVDSLVIGATHLRHVPFLVVADTNGAFVGIPPGQHAILGIQPLLALGTLSFRRNGTIHIAGKAEPASTTAPLLFDGALPLSEIVYRGRPLTVTFDMGATQTTLDPPFAKLYPETLRSGNSENHTLNGISGSTVQRSVSLPHLAFTFGRDVDLAPATILLDETTGASAWAAANLGYDLMQQARPFTIDFQRMVIVFPAAH